MADYTTVNHSYAGDSTNPRRYLAWVWDLVQSESDWFEIVESQGNWSDPANLGPGDYFVVGSKSNGWQALFALSGAAIGGYADPGGGDEYPYLLADYLGKWSTITHIFDGGSVTGSNFRQIDDQAALSTDPFRGFWTAFHYEDPRQPGVIIDGLAVGGMPNNSNVLGTSFYVGWVESFEPISLTRYPFTYITGAFRPETPNYTHGYCADDTGGVLQVKLWQQEYLYGIGKTTVKQRPVTIPLAVVEVSTAAYYGWSPGLGYLPYIELGDHDLANQCNDDATRYLAYGISWPIQSDPGW